MRFVYVRDGISYPWSLSGQARASPPLIAPLRHHEGSVKLQTPPPRAHRTRQHLPGAEQCRPTPAPAPPPPLRRDLRSDPVDAVSPASPRGLRGRGRNWGHPRGGHSSSPWYRWVTRAAIKPHLPPSDAPVPVRIVNGCPVDAVVEVLGRRVPQAQHPEPADLGPLERRREALFAEDRIPLLACGQRVRAGGPAGGEPGGGARDRERQWQRGRALMSTRPAGIWPSVRETPIALLVAPTVVGDAARGLRLPSRCPSVSRGRG